MGSIAKFNCQFFFCISSVNSILFHKLMPIVMFWGQNFIIKVDSFFHKSQQSGQIVDIFIGKRFFHGFDHILSMVVDGFFNIFLLITWVYFSQEVTDVWCCFFILSESEGIPKDIVAKEFCWQTCEGIWVEFFYFVVDFVWEFEEFDNKYHLFFCYFFEILLFSPEIFKNIFF